MKRIYLVKKNPNAPDGAENWIVMDGKEYYTFIQTPEGKRREKSFGQLDGCGADDVIIFAECGEESAREWRAYKDRADYLKEQEENSTFIGFQLEEENEDDLDGSGAVPDPDCNVEEEIIRKLTLEKLRTALQTLSDQERELIQILFLDADPISESEYGRRLGVTQHCIYRRKLKVLEKLRKMLG